MWRDEKGKVISTKEVIEEVKLKYHLVCTFCERSFRCEKAEENMLRGCEDFEPIYTLGYRRIVTIRDLPYILERLRELEEHEGGG